MTQPIEIQRHVYAADGVLTDFGYTFTVVDTDSIKVYVDNVLESNTNYTVNTASLLIEFDVAPVNGAIVTLIRSTDLDQASDLGSDPYELAIDHVERQIQDLQEQLDRSIKTRRQDSHTVELPAFVANRFIKINATGTGFDLSAADLSDLDQAISDADADAAATAADLVATNQDTIDTAADAVSANNAAAAAATSADFLDDRMLGAFTDGTEPTLDNDGNALLTGAQYFNTDLNRMKVYNGATWQLTTANAVDVAIADAGGLFTGTDVEAALQEAANVLKTKVIDIGDWNMDITGQVTVAHGLTEDNIRGVEAFIRSDGAVGGTPLAVPTTAGVAGSLGWTSTQVYLNRISGAFFDSNVDYISTSYNRGWITIRYV